MIVQRKVELFNIWHSHALASMQHARVRPPLRMHERRRDYYASSPHSPQNAGAQFTLERADQDCPCSAGTWSSRPCRQRAASGGRWTTFWDRSERTVRMISLLTTRVNILTANANTLPSAINPYL